MDLNINEKFEIFTKRLRLSIINEDDLLPITEIVNNINISKQLDDAPHPYTITHAKELYDKMIHDLHNKNPSFYFTIHFNEGNSCAIGAICLIPVEGKEEERSIGYYLNEQFWRKGIMYEAAKEIVKFAFQKLHSKRLFIDPFSDNFASIGLAKKLGFREIDPPNYKSKSMATNIMHDNCRLEMNLEEYLTLNSKF